MNSMKTGIKSRVVHYDTSTNYVTKVACHNRPFLDYDDTKILAHVTCLHCKQSKAYKDALAKEIALNPKKEKEVIKMSEKIVHLDISLYGNLSGYKRAACGVHYDSSRGLTRDIDKVTCINCMCTNAYKDINNSRVVAQEVNKTLTKVKTSSKAVPSALGNFSYYVFKESNPDKVFGVNSIDDAIDMVTNFHKEALKSPHPVKLENWIIAQVIKKAVPNSSLVWSDLPKK